MNRTILPLTALVAAAVAPECALANPMGGSVAAGSASITTAPGQVTINQSSARVIINWQGFSIGPGEITQFNQPSSGAVALNRITGGDPSIILGQLSANGRILLINPDGVLFGAGSRTDVSGLIATTANLSDQDFMAGSLNFSMPSSSPTASVVNRGSISVAQGGLVALVAPGVANDGVITARLGRVSLVSADRFTVDFHGDQLIQFALDDSVARTVVAPDGMSLSAAVSNAGRIVADGGTVQMSANVASGVLDHVIDMSGVVEARSVRQVDGTVVLDGGASGTVAVSGRIDVSGRGATQTGGTVQILGQHVGLFAGASVDASGGAGGGTVLVGGNLHGQGPQPNAQATYVDPQATIDADATVKGNGGTVVVWSDQYTNFGGTITARGGPQGGNGGYVETSSHAVLTATGQVNASAANGTPGLWLLDPSNVTITSGTSNGTFTGGNSVFTPSGGGTATADAGTISTALSGGTSVTINTASSDTQTGNITFGQSSMGAADGSITMNGPSGTTATLTLNAAGGIAIGSTSPTITASSGNTLNVSITMGNAAATSCGANSGACLPAMTLNGGSLTIASTGGHIYQNGPLVSSGAVTINADTAGAGHGVSLTDPGNNFTGVVSLTNLGGSPPSGNFNSYIVTQGALTLGTTSLIGGGNSGLSITAGGAITQTGAITDTASGGAPIMLAVSTAGSDILLNTQANNIAGTVSLGGTASNVRDFALRNTNAGANTPDLSGATNLRNLTLQFDNAAVALGAITASGNVSITAGGAISQSAALSVGGTSAFSAGANAITLIQAGNSFTGAVSLDNTGNNNVDVSASGALVLGASSVGSGTLDLLATAGITQTGAVTQTNAATGPVILQGGAGAITLTNTGNQFYGDLNLTNTGNAVSITAASPLAVGASTIGTGLTLTTDQLDTPGTVGAVTSTLGGTLTIQPLTASTNVTLGGLGGAGLQFTDAMRVNYHGFTGVTVGSATGTGTVSLGAAETLGAANLTLRAGGAGGAVTTAGQSLTLTGAGTLTLSAGGTVTIGTVTLATGALTVTAGSGTTLTAAIQTAGSAITLNGPITLAGATTLNTSLTGASGNITLNGAVSGAGNTLTLNAGSAGDISLQSVGAAGATLAGITIQNARNVTATGLVATNALTQSAGTGTTNFGGAGVSSSGAVSLTTNAVAGTFNVQSFTVTSGQTVVTGSIDGTSGTAAAAQASDPGSTGTQTFNGCTIASSTCAALPPPPPPPASSGPSPGETATATSTANQTLGVLSSSGSDDSGDSGQQNGHGFEATIPLQNIDWSDPAGDLRVKLAPEYRSLGRFFYAHEPPESLEPKPTPAARGVPKAPAAQKVPGAQKVPEAPAGCVAGGGFGPDCAPQPPADKP